MQFKVWLSFQPFPVPIEARFIQSECAYKGTVDLLIICLSVLQMFQFNKSQEKNIGCSRKTDCCEYSIIRYLSTTLQNSCFSFKKMIDPNFSTFVSFCVNSLSYVHCVVLLHL